MHVLFSTACTWWTEPFFMQSSLDGPSILHLVALILPNFIWQVQYAYKHPRNKPVLTQIVFLGKNFKCWWVLRLLGGTTADWMSTEVFYSVMDRQVVNDRGHLPSSSIIFRSQSWWYSSGRFEHGDRCKSEPHEGNLLWAGTASTQVLKCWTVEGTRKSVIKEEIRDL